MQNKISPRERVNLALSHKAPDRVPVDFLATAEVWESVGKYLGLVLKEESKSGYFDSLWESVLRFYQVDCRVISYDQFFRPPDSFFTAGDLINWWDALSRSTPNRMFRRINKDGLLYDLWGHGMRVVENPTGAYEEIIEFPLRDASPSDVIHYAWPKPDWWDFGPLSGIIDTLNAYESYHLRFRAGSIFEVAWQLCGMDKFLMDLAIDPKVPLLIMDHLTDITVELLDRVLRDASDRLDTVYFYDDVATQSGLMISKSMWRKFIKPRHMRLVEVAKNYDTKVMYHCDGSIYPLIAELIDMGVDLLNPIQVDAKNMDAERLKDEFGDKLCFHGAVDNIQTLPFGSPRDVRDEVRERIQVLGSDGGYVMASTHHIQSNTPPENVDAMYDIKIRQY